MPYFKSDPDNERGSLWYAAPYAKSCITRNLKTSILRYLRMKQKQKAGDVEDASKETLKMKKILEKELIIYF